MGTESVKEDTGHRYWFPVIDSRTQWITQGKDISGPLLDQDFSIDLVAEFLVCAMPASIQTRVAVPDFLSISA